MDRWRRTRGGLGMTERVGPNRERLQRAAGLREPASTQSRGQDRVERGLR